MTQFNELATFLSHGLILDIQIYNLYPPIDIQSDQINARIQIYICQGGRWCHTFNSIQSARAHNRSKHSNSFYYMPSAHTVISYCVCTFHRKHSSKRISKPTTQPLKNNRLWALPPRIRAWIVRTYTGEQCENVNIISSREHYFYYI